MKIDPNKNKERYLNWRDKTSEGIPDISVENSKIIKQFLSDMELGINVANGSRKGARSYVRLNTLKDRMVLLAKHLKKHLDLDNIVDIKEEQLMGFFVDMRNGKIRRNDGKEYKSVVDYVKTLKAFWHWYMKVEKKQGKEIEDICVDLDTSKEKAQWVYLTEEQVRKLCDNAKYFYKVLIMFLYDSGIRAPTEMMNVKVSDLYEDCKVLNIRDEISKTFGRKIKLLLCSGLLKRYIKEQDLKDDDYLFSTTPFLVNKYLKRLAKRVLGEEVSLAGQEYFRLSMYDFRHSSACYWLPRYKSESALKYRFGWKKSDMIYYYTELLGMKDTISDDDLLIDVTKTEIEKRLMRAEQDRDLFQEKLKIMEEQMIKIQELTEELYGKIK